MCPMGKVRSRRVADKLVPILEKRFGGTWTVSRSGSGEVWLLSTWDGHKADLPKADWFIRGYVACQEEYHD